MEIIGIVAMSLDGCMTRHDEAGADFASAADRRVFDEALAGCDCCLMGSRTYEGGRERILAGLERERLRVVLTSAPGRYRADARPGRLEFRGGEVAAVLEELRAAGFRRCALLGGTTIYTECVARGLLTELWLTVEPVGFGSGRRLFEGRHDFRFEL
ncbi:MAG: dihydrofolate reductase family protein, partial [Gemmatimonadales bacterium]